ncbi:hypothetical protein [Acidomonas methanolica]|uniref:Uncharacterized protein n=1 Tax=Acidomonas methanolica NBRC 104435 TaxID=1231351 RepID=A0A023D5E8_ACIMT|nr:hypothetical protein [Acidomonas methanolica]MBU2654898.1 hypothetical protein [Acidomonas methanolica]TCS29443.1 hypothetical protein EDC31_10611 [Acidomonas methanolica]GAJ29284.1 hypothetical protein Amme_059_003 [Acidomonas methanolica NBRC 104435]GBQ45700.1 hypothetical protein AA0498_0121 [Acidomonas methanolica]GEK99048.1 hypothetical protein AME01nite_15470 [Acidomonas methanolica NBRC 104435]
MKVTTETASTGGTNQPETRLATVRIGVRKHWDEATILAIRASIVSLPSACAIGLSSMSAIDFVPDASLIG